MTPAAHGTRPRYRQGCGCTRCRAANAARASTDRRRRQRPTGPHGELRRATDGKQRAIEARLRIRQLEREGYPKARIARLAGLQRRSLYIRPGQSIRRRTLERILRVARFAMLEGIA